MRLKVSQDQVYDDDDVGDDDDDVDDDCDDDDTRSEHTNLVSIHNDYRSDIINLFFVSKSLENNWHTLSLTIKTGFFANVCVSAGMHVSTSVCVFVYVK